MGQVDSTRPSLLLRLRDGGDSAAWQDFVAVYGPLIRGYCRRRGLQDADASDMEQEVLAQVARSIAGFEYRPDRGRFRDWLGTVVRRKIARFLATQARRGRAVGGEESEAPFTAIDDPGDDPEWLEAFHAHILESAAARVRPSFAPTTWDAFLRVWADDRPAPEVARELGLTIDAVYAAKSRVLRRLREEVVALAEDMPVTGPLG